MHDLNFREMTKEELQEESLIDLAYAILEDRKSAITLPDLLKEIQNLNGMTDEEIKGRLVQFYTDLNVEGRFLLNQENGWGLREWYKVETIEEETAPTVKARKKKKAVVGDDDELFDEIDEDDLVFEDEIDEFIDEDEEDDEDVVIPVLPDFDVVDEDEEDVELVDFVEEEIDDLDEEIDEDLIDDEDDFAEEELEDDSDLK